MAHAGFDLRSFASPGTLFRGVPFWAWNDRLEPDTLVRQIAMFQKMGFGGVNLHPRTGLATQYLGDEFMRAVKLCVDEAKSRGMTCWLYDEDRWPSGYAGGRVTRDSPEFRARHLLWTCTPYGRGAARKTSDYTNAVRTENGRLLARFEVALLEGRLVSYRRLRDNEADAARTWYAYVESPEPNGWFNGATMVDSLSRPAVERFLALTHDRYRAAVGEHFSHTVPAIFTDEPQHIKKSAYALGTDTHDLFMPWAEDFSQTFSEAFESDILAALPELFWNRYDDSASQPRYRYHEHLAARFAHAFSQTIARWCDANTIQLTGHALGEATLHGQTRGGSDAMRTLAPFHLPGIDILCDKYEFTTAKQAQSIARQFSRPGVMSELYGVTNWDFDFVGHKAQGDWQATMGVSFRVPHLAWMSMRGEAKRDYPASIFYQSPWWERYRLIEDHFARLNVALRSGASRPRVAMLHPLESTWLNWGPADQNHAALAAIEASFASITARLAHGLIDFDYLNESLLATMPAEVVDGELVVGAMRYRAIVVPEMSTIRRTTLALLQRFRAAGGRLIFAGAGPTMVNCHPSTQLEEVIESGQKVSAGANGGMDPLVDALADLSDIRATTSDGRAANGLLAIVNHFDDQRIVFVVNTDRVRPLDAITLRVDGTFDVCVLDTQTGSITLHPAPVDSGTTSWRWNFTPHGHCLVQLTPTTGKTIAIEPPAAWRPLVELSPPLKVSLSEPNVLLLDQAQWTIDPHENSWQPATELLRVDNELRRRFALPLRNGRSAQPWADTAPAGVLTHLRLRFGFRSSVALEGIRLACEPMTGMSIWLDGTKVAIVDDGFWVDESIRTLCLPAIAAGEHVLELNVPYTRMTDLEWCYLLGHFSIASEQEGCALGPAIRALAWGDWTAQGLPFYTGNVTYHCTLPTTAATARVRCESFKAPLIDAMLEDGVLRPIAFAPFAAELGEVRAGQTLDLIAYGNRFNAFGCVHHADRNLKWVGPAAWRSTGPLWSDRRLLKPMGILAAPVVEAR